MISYNKIFGENGFFIKNESHVCKTKLQKIFYPLNDIFPPFWYLTDKFPCSLLSCMTFFTFVFFYVVQFSSSVSGCGFMVSEDLCFGGKLLQFMIVNFFIRLGIDDNFLSKRS